MNSRMNFKHMKSSEKYKILRNPMRLAKNAQELQFELMLSNSVNKARVRRN